MYNKSTFALVTLKNPKKYVVLDAMRLWRAKYVVRHRKSSKPYVYYTENEIFAVSRHITPPKPYGLEFLTPYVERAR